MRSYDGNIYRLSGSEPNTWLSDAFTRICAMPMARYVVGDDGSDYLCYLAGETGTARLPSAQAPEGLPVQYWSISSFKHLKYLKM